ncbi:MAG TPA: PKD domain-containing protein, partial [Bacteroidales bacterium]|nr:PKD domain-containing protein [Bacteroidales bacterium]
MRKNFLSLIITLLISAGLIAQNINNVSEKEPKQINLVKTNLNTNNKINNAKILNDNTPPITNILPISAWQTQDFDITFYDSDAESGIQKAYYQVIEYDGIDWGANAKRGFLGDNFDAPSINDRWNIITGNWTQQNGYLMHTDTTVYKSYINTYLNQELSNRYLYEFEIRILGNNKTNKRFGFYFFSSDSLLENGGNGYFVWFRLETNNLEFYKVTNNTFTKTYEVPCTINLNQWYNIKVIYDRIDGGIWVYVNNLFKGKWIDSQPYNTNGRFVSFRTGNCIAQFNQIKIYRSRYPNTAYIIGVGNNNTKDLRYESINPSSPAGKIKSIIQDSADNLSNLAMLDVFVDYTTPLPPSFVWDGIGQDYDTIFMLPMSAQWGQANDPNSGISNYKVCIGTVPGYDNTLPWTNVGINNFYSFYPNSLINYNYYYLTVKSINNAGLDTITSSDGFVFTNPFPIIIDFSASDTLLPLNNASVHFFQLCQNVNSYIWDFGDGIGSLEPNPIHTYTSPGYYTVKLIGCNMQNKCDSLIKTNFIQIHDNTGINNYDQLQIDIYPNPAQDIFYIQSPNPINEVIIINNLGQIVATYSETSIINIDQLANGVYQIIIKTNKEIYNSFIVK